MILREVLDLDAALDRSLSLESMGIAHEIVAAPDGRWALAVDEADAAAAEAVLLAFEAEAGEAAAARGAPAPAPDYGRSLVGVAAALGLLGFAAAVAFRLGASWVERGDADAARMLAGEWWRAATALTLHADAGHAGANAAAVAVLLTALARRLGPALAAWVALAAGIAGNAATALAAPAGHVSLGASTAIFGALGALSALQAPERRTWLTLGAGVALLGLLGTGARADLFAHLFGFAAGVIEGLPLRRVTPPRRSLLQPALALCAVAPLALAWWRALG